MTARWSSVALGIGGNAGIEGDPGSRAPAGFPTGAWRTVSEGDVSAGARDA
jgi:hypothetical protein